MGPRRRSLLLFPCFTLTSWLPIYAQNAPGAPGTMPTWTPGSKEAVGTATTTDSHIWFTLQGGVLSEVYYPRLDTADVRTLEFAVSDGLNHVMAEHEMFAIRSRNQNPLLAG